MTIERYPQPGFPEPPPGYSRSNETEFRRQLERYLNDLVAMITRQDMRQPITTDATRGGPGIPGRVLFNIDDQNLNIDDGQNWILPNGTTT